MSQLPEEVFQRIEDALGQWSAQIAEAHGALSAQLTRAKDQIDIPAGGSSSSLRREMAEIKEVLLAYHEAAKAQAEQIHGLTESVQELYAQIRQGNEQAAIEPASGELAAVVDTLREEVARLDGEIKTLSPVHATLAELRSLVDQALEQGGASPADFANGAALPDDQFGDAGAPPREQEPIYAFNADGSRRRMGEILVAGGRLTDDQLADALQAQELEPHRRLGVILEERGYCGAEDIARVIASQLHLAFVELENETIMADAVSLLPAKVAQQHKCVPLSATPDEIVLAMANPLDLIAVEDVERATNRRAVPAVASVHDIEAAIARHYPDSAAAGNPPQA